MKEKKDGVKKKMLLKIPNWFYKELLLPNFVNFNSRDAFGDEEEEIPEIFFVPRNPRSIQIFWNSSGKSDTKFE